MLGIRSAHRTLLGLYPPMSVRRIGVFYFSRPGDSLRLFMLRYRRPDTLRSERA